jgi:hypothetical protein
MQLPADHSNPGGLPPPRPSTGFDGTPLDKSSALGLNSFVSSRGEGRIAIVTVRGAGCGGRDRCSIARGAQTASGLPETQACRGGDDHIDADGPSRGIPAHRLAPWGSAKVRSSYRGRAEAWKSPRAVVQPKGRTPGVSRSKPLTPSRAERRMRPVLSWCLHSCAFSLCA